VSICSFFSTNVDVHPLTQISDLLQTMVSMTVRYDIEHLITISLVLMCYVAFLTSLPTADMCDW